ncbi:hypothetical protein FQN60_014375 [Etheostoma spectabile]|uniref:Heat shock factor binding protein 1 n=1 Tax=Etheostoma spectabile TaxID=54343 RepID=A0A5J5DDJ0_9PERO|nr:hypothetical protein FQN60_014375 [Etheostoma spectabile]
MAETDPKSVQDLTNVVQTLLQQMQDKFQTMLVWKRLRQHLKRLKRDKAPNGVAWTSIFSSCSSQRFTAAFFRSTSLTENIYKKAGAIE